MTLADDPLYPRIITYLRKQTRKSKSLRGSGLVARIARDLHADRIDVLREMRQLRAEGVVDCDDWMRDEPQTKVTIHLPEQLSAAAITWREVLQAHGFGSDSAGFTALQEIGDKLDGLDRESMQGLLAGLTALARDQDMLAGTPRFEVSARYLLGSSKMLDALTSLALQALGIDISRFPSFPGYVMVAGPSEPVSVILVENPHSFETVMTTNAPGQAAWICSYGYGLSLKHSQHGEQLASILANPTAPRTLSRRGNPPPWETLVQHPRLQFWGDLDLEGLAIFERLRSHRPDITLSGLYRPMLEALQRGAGHPYCQATGKPRQRIPRHGHDITDLIDLCRHQAIDQEMVTPTQIAQHWEQPLMPKQPLA
jgi:hypothetical protein